MTTTELESRVGAMLRAKAAQVEPDRAAFDPTAVPLGGPERPHRRPSLLAAAAVLVVVVGGAIAVVLALGGSDGDPARPTRPAGPPVAHLEIHALPDLRYQADEFTTVPGVNEIRLVDFGGTHGLVFADPALAHFRLSVPEGTDRALVDLEAGRDYTIYCPIPGHRQAGMEAVIHVTGSEAAPTKGTMPAAASDGTIDPGLVPDFVATVDRSGARVGYVARGDLVGPTSGDRRQTVWGEDLRTVVGHMYPGRGFVPVGTDPATVETFPSSTTSPTTAPGGAP